MITLWCSDGECTRLLLRWRFWRGSSVWSRTVSRPVRAARRRRSTCRTWRRSFGRRSRRTSVCAERTKHCDCVSPGERSDHNPAISHAAVLMRCIIVFVPNRPRSLAPTRELCVWWLCSSSSPLPSAPSGKHCSCNHSLNNKRIGIEQTLGTDSSGLVPMQVKHLNNNSVFWQQMCSTADVDPVEECVCFHTEQLSVRYWSYHKHNIYQLVTENAFSTEWSCFIRVQ